MGYYDREKNVASYVRMAEGYDGAELIGRLKAHLPEGATVLELGMGPGKDLDLLRQSYRVTGSDTSKPFLDRYQRLHPQADLLSLDARTLDTDRTFDCIYSNKVLQHLTRKDLTASFLRQSVILSEHGLILHSFWYGAGEEINHGLLCTYHTEKTLREILGKGFDILELQRYQEMEPDDSLYLLARKKS